MIASDSSKTSFFKVHDFGIDKSEAIKLDNKNDRQKSFLNGLRCQNWRLSEKRLAISSVN